MSGTLSLDSLFPYTTRLSWFIILTSQTLKYSQMRYYLSPAHLVWSNLNHCLSPVSHTAGHSDLLTVSQDCQAMSRHEAFAHVTHCVEYTFSPPDSYPLALHSQLPTETSQGSCILPSSPFHVPTLPTSQTRVPVIVVTTLFCDACLALTLPTQSQSSLQESLCASVFMYSATYRGLT